MIYKQGESCFVGATPQTPGGNTAKVHVKPIKSDLSIHFRRSDVIRNKSVCMSCISETPSDRRRTYSNYAEDWKQHEKSSMIFILFKLHFLFECNQVICILMHNAAGTHLITVIKSYQNAVQVEDTRPTNFFFFEELQAVVLTHPRM